MVYRDLPWRDNPEPPDEPTDDEIFDTPEMQELGRPFYERDQMPEYAERVRQARERLAERAERNELFDAPPAEPHRPRNEDWYIDQYAEEMLSGPEPEEPNPFHGTYYEDDGE